MATSYPAVGAIKAIVTITQTSPAAVSTVAGTASSSSIDLSAYDDIFWIYASLGATGGVLDVYVQDILDGVYYDLVHFNQIAAAAAAATQAACGCLHSYAVAIGSGVAPALAVGTVRPGRWGKQMRLCCVAGAGTSAGALQSVTIFGRRAR